MLMMMTMMTMLTMMMRRELHVGAWNCHVCLRVCVCARVPVCVRGALCVCVCAWARVYMRACAYVLAVRVAYGRHWRVEDVWPVGRGLRGARGIGTERNDKLHHHTVKSKNFKESEEGKGREGGDRRWTQIMQQTSYAHG